MELLRWDRLAPQFPVIFIWSYPRLGYKIHKSPIKSHSRRSTGCCCTRTCWQDRSYFRHIWRSNSAFLRRPCPYYWKRLYDGTAPGGFCISSRWDPTHHLSMPDRYLITEYLDVVERVKAYILSHPDVQFDTTRWIEGWGWDQTKWSIAQFPTAVRLDFTTVRMMSSYFTTEGWSWSRPIAKGSADFPKAHRWTRFVGFFSCSQPNTRFAWNCRWWIDCAGQARKSQRYICR